MISFQLTYPLPLDRPVFPGLLHRLPHVQESSVARSNDRPSDNSSDERLIHASIGGDERAFRYLVERYQNHVTRTVTGMLGKTRDVDDCVQDVFIRLYASLARYRGEASIKTYVTRIAINRSLDVLRKKKRSFFTPWDSSEIEMVESSAPRPDDDVVSSDQRKQLRAALDCLTPRHRSVVVLRLIDGFSTAETADVLGVPYGTVLSRLTRALDKLNHLLGDKSGFSAASLRSTSNQGGSGEERNDKKIDNEDHG